MPTAPEKPQTYRSMRGSCYCRICRKVYPNPPFFALMWNMVRSSYGAPVVKDPNELTPTEKVSCPNCLRDDSLKTYNDFDPASLYA